MVDVPQCPAGARKLTVDNITSCYTFHLTPKSWSDAVEMCKTEAPNAHLVSVNSKKEQDFLVDTIRSDACKASLIKYYLMFNLITILISHIV